MRAAVSQSLRYAFTLQFTNFNAVVINNGDLCREYVP